MSHFAEKGYPSKIYGAIYKGDPNLDNQEGALNK